MVHALSVSEDTIRSAVESHFPAQSSSCVIRWFKNHKSAKHRSNVELPETTSQDVQESSRWVQHKDTKMNVQDTLFVCITFSTLEGEALEENIF